MPREKPATSWIYRQSKEQLLVVLKAYKVEVTPQYTVDTLRKLLVQAVLGDAESEDSNDETLDTLDVDGRDLDREQTGESEDTSEGESPNTTIMAESKIKLEFDASEDDWETFTERLELYFIATGIADAEKQKAVMLTKVSSKTYTLIRDLCAPQKPRDKTLEELQLLIKNHLCPQPSEAVERCKFHQAAQLTTESVSEFVARLRKLAIYCNFQDLNAALRDQLVCGLREEESRVLLFREDKLTFDNAYKIAVGQEKAKADANIRGNISVPESEVQDVNFIKKKKSGKSGAAMKPPIRNTGSKSAISPRSCYCCGGPNHWAKNCRHRWQTCTYCGKKGHMERVCRSKHGASSGGKQQVRYLEHTGEDADGNNTDTTEDSLFIQINSLVEDSVEAPMYITVNIDGVEVEMEVDTGTRVSVMSLSKYKALVPSMKLESTKAVLNNYGNFKIVPLGIAKIKAKLGDLERVVDLYIMENEGPTLIGRQWLRAFGMWPIRLSTKDNNVNKIEVCQVKEKLIKLFPELFSRTPGLFNKGSLELKLKPNTQPVALKAHPFPFALKEKIENELDRLEAAGHIEKVQDSEWATPIVPVRKGREEIRLCGNFKLTVNSNLIVNKHPLPNVDDIFVAMQGGELFSEIDLSHAYMQIPVSENCRECLTIVTHKGLYRYKKLPEGIASGPGDFQKKMEHCLMGIKNVAIYLDNIYVTGKNAEEHFETLKTVCHKLQESGLRVNSAKCKLFQDKLEMLGFIIDKTGLSTSPNKVKAIVEAPIPQNVQQLESFLGLITFYARFLPDRAGRLKPLYECTKGDTLEWTQQCEDAVQWVKDELSSERVLAHYDPAEQLILACDASSYGLSAILSHRYKDNTERPIEFASKVIPEKECSRAIIDKEAGAIIFGFKKFYRYIYGREIILRTDHKPLLYIFGPKTGIPTTTANRLQRWAFFLAGFTYQMEHISSKDNGNCDALSRLPIHDNTPVFDKECYMLNYVTECIPILDQKLIEQESAKCNVLKKIIRYTREGWISKDKLTETEKEYYNVREDLTLEDGCLMRGTRVVIPANLKELMLSELHESHPGIVKMKSMARSCVWWPGIDKEIESTVKSCKICAEECRAPEKVPLTPWPWPGKAWTRIHSDFLGPFFGKRFMIVIDAHSKWPEVIDMGQSATAQQTIEACKDLFVKHGYPKLIVTDNGSQYTSEEFSEFVKKRGIYQCFSPPYHPATNGAAENFVKTFKSRVKKIVKSGKSLKEAIRLFLFDYRTSPHCTTNRSPASLLYKRELRTRFSLLKPDTESFVLKKQQQQIDGKKGRRNVTFSEGDTVMVDDHRVRSEKRVEAVIKKQLSPVTYLVAVEPNLVWKRHVDQIISFESKARVSESKEVEQKDTLRRSERIKARTGN